MVKKTFSKFIIKFSVRAFTLIELLVAIAIIGLLASIILVSLQGATASARDGKRDAEVGESNSVLRKTLEVYHSAHGNYPWNEATEDEDGCCLEGNNDVKASLTEYLSDELKDPLYDSDEPDTLDKQCYRYKTINNGEEYKVRVNYETGGYKEVASWGGGGIGYWSCGDDVTFTYRGSSVTYGTVSHNSECWLDRNLGASQQATAYNDYNAYGGSFQWGRLDDGHQTIVWTSPSGSDGTEQSRETSTLADSDTPGHDNFILGSADHSWDWRVPQNDILWQGASGINNPCPSGWRLPTKTEWEAELASWSSNDRDGAYASPLKLTVVGNRDWINGSLDVVGVRGYYWSSGVDGALLFFAEFGAFMNARPRAAGHSVRCIKD